MSNPARTGPDRDRAAVAAREREQAAARVLGSPEIQEALERSGLSGEQVRERALSDLAEQVGVTYTDEIAAADASLDERQRDSWARRLLTFISSFPEIAGIVGVGLAGAALIASLF